MPIIAVTVQITSKACQTRTLSKMRKLLLFHSNRILWWLASRQQLSTALLSA